MPTLLKIRAREAWKKETILSEGEFYFQLDENSLPFSLIQEAANEAALYLVSHPIKLTTDRARALSPYVTDELKIRLREKVHPTIPTEISGDQGVISWFINEYLPYREWQATTEDSSAFEQVVRSAKEFMTWYLDLYPKMLLGHSLQTDLSFQKMYALAGENRAMVTLVVLLDGLGISDSKKLVALIHEQISNIQIKKEAVAFSPLPTVTQFCKDALLKGVEPRFAPSGKNMGQIISGGKSPASVLQTAQNGEIYIWSILEPDETYHKFSDPSILKRNVESVLEGIVKKIKDVVDKIPGELSLELIITTDHGRLMSKSERKLPIPPGFESHGRAAWGKSGKNFPSSGYLIEGDLVYLHASSFGLSEDAVLPMTMDTFLTVDAKHGNEAYSHGGLYPEEVLIPWIEFGWDVVHPPLEAHISGSGYAENRGNLVVQIMNLGEDEIQVETLEIFIPGEKSHIISLNWQMPALDQCKYDLPVDWWPTIKQSKQISAKLRVKGNQGPGFVYPVDVQLEVKELYSTEGADILGDLQ